MIDNLRNLTEEQYFRLPTSLKKYSSFFFAQQIQFKDFHDIPYDPDKLFPSYVNLDQDQTEPEIFLHKSRDASDD